MRNSWTSMVRRQEAGDEFLHESKGRNENRHGLSFLQVEAAGRENFLVT
jgi:hypothetical protein